MNKRAEIVYKTVFKNARSSELSAINPKKYKDRFYNFVKQSLLMDDITS
jgi:hypothetical protein